MVADLTYLMGEETQEVGEMEAPEGELFLKFKLGNGVELALPAVAVAEVMSIGPEKITPMPNVSPLLLGTLNLRGEIIWVADLGQFLGEGVPLNLDRAEIPVIAVMEQQDLLLALAVDLIVGMEWLKADSVKQSQSYSQAMAPFVRGVWERSDGRTVLPLLDQVAILRSNLWAA
ncbi:MAG: CheW domain-containing protein [Cyanobacteriota bacterium]|nr:CheW domain-containing protein [Cyanobacteriota bacterium]